MTWVEDLERDGFAICGSGLDTESLQRLRDRFSQAGRRAGRRNALAEPLVDELARGPLLHFAKAVLGDAAKPVSGDLV